MIILNKYKSGASLKGLLKEDSTLNYKKYIYENIDKESIIILKFGQVDMEYGYYYTNIIKKISISIDDYIKHF